MTLLLAAVIAAYVRGLLNGLHHASRERWQVGVIGQMQRQWLAANERLGSQDSG